MNRIRRWAGVLLTGVVLGAGSVVGFAQTSDQAFARYEALSTQWAKESTRCIVYGNRDACRRAARLEVAEATAWATFNRLLDREIAAPVDPPTPRYTPSGSGYTGADARGYPWASTCPGGSCFGDISSVTGLPRTVYVHGYTRSDGTYVGSYYRSR